jgi:uncharacterized protein YdeI (YjbR/CyaY-like superfamily)
MSTPRRTKYFTFEDRRHWRAWLRTNHLRVDHAWLALPKRGYQGESVTYEQAVEEALCYGWIDGLLHKLDETRFLLRFSPRRAGSIWSQSNKQRVIRLVRQKRMTAWGMAKVKEAKRSGQWLEAERREHTDRPPADLLAELRKDPAHWAAWRALPASSKKMVLYWLASAKREATRQKRLRLVAERWLTAGPDS